MKRILAILLTVSMTLGIMPPVTVLAEENDPEAACDTTSQGTAYQTEDGESYPEFQLGENDIEIGSEETVFVQFVAPKTGYYCIYSGDVPESLDLNLFDINYHVDTSGRWEYYEGVTTCYVADQLTEGETYYLRISTGLEENSATVCWKIMDVTVESIQIETEDTIENTKGCWGKQYFEPELYWNYYLGPDHTISHITVNYADGRSYSGTWTEVMEEIYTATGRHPDYYIDGISQSYDNQLMAGNTYTQVLKLDGYTTEYEVRIVETPIESITIETVEITENTNGYWQNYGEPEQYWCYWVEPHNVIDNISVTYVDGNSFSGTWNEVHENIYTTIGRSPDYYYEGVSQSYDNQLAAGNTYTQVLMFDGYTTEYEVRIVETPIESITIETVEITENTNGCWQNLGESEQYWYYYTEPYNTDVQLTVTYKDGSVYNGTWDEVYEEIYNATGRYPDYEMNGLSQNNENPLIAGNTYNAVLKIDGYATIYEIRIVERINPVISIAFEPIEVIENTNGCWQNHGDPEQYWYYYTEPYRVDMMTVTYKDGSVYSGTWDEIQNAIYEATGNYPDCKCEGITQSYENQLKAGETYTGFLTFDSYAMEYEVRIVETPIESIVVETTEIVENTTGSWENYGEPEQYWYYYTGPDRIDVTYKDGSVYSGTWYEVRNAINEATGREPEYSYDSISQGYENQLIVGETYTGILTFDGYTTDYTVRIVETPIESIVVETKQIIEYTNGMWQNRGEPKQCWYYFTDPYNANLQMTVTYKDGSVYSGTWNEVRNAIKEVTGKDPHYSYNDVSQSYDNQLIAGETYIRTLSLEGYKTEYSIEILESPIESIVAEPQTVIAGTNGSYQTAWENDTIYWYYYSLDPQIYHVVLKNGEVISGSSNEIYNKLGESPSLFIYQFKYDTTSGNRIYGLDVGEYTYEVSFLGQFCEYNVSIVESPIDHITVSPIRLIENYGGTMMEDGWYKYDLSSNGSVTVEVTFKDGSVRVDTNGYISSSALSFSLDNVRYGFFLEDTQSADNPWTKGSHYVTATLPDGITTATLEYVVGDTPIKDIILDEIVLFENQSGYYYGSDDEKWFYYSVYNPGGWVILDDDTKVKIYSGAVWLDDGSRYYIAIPTDQSVDNPWGVGEHECVVSVAGYQKTIKVQVLPCQIESVELFPITVVENQLGYWRSEIGGDKWFRYDVEDYTVNGWIRFRNGSECLLSDAISSGMIRRYQSLLLYSDQSYENQWKVGENEAYCSIGAVEYPVTVIVEENPINEITIDDLYLKELEDYYIDKEGHVRVSNFDFSKLCVNVELKDGSTLQLTQGAYESGLGAVNAGFIYREHVYGFLYNGSDTGWVFNTWDLNGFHPDKPSSEWIAGDVITFTAYIMGEECHFKVHFAPEQYLSLTISDDDDLVLTFMRADGKAEILRATELYLDTDGRWGYLYTDKGNFSMADAFEITFDGKTYREALQAGELSGLKNVQIRVENLTSNVLEDAGWFIDQLSPNQVIVKTIPEAIALAQRSLEYNVAEYDGEITEENIDFLIETAFAYSIGYTYDEVYRSPYGGVSVYRSEDSIIDAVCNLFGLGKEEIDLTVSPLYVESKRAFRIPITYADQFGDITETMDSEEGILIWHSQGISAFVKNGIIEKITLVPNAYAGDICELADGNLWYVARYLVQTQYSGEIEIDGTTYEIENGKVIVNDYPEGAAGVQGCSLTLNGDIGLNFYLNLDSRMAEEGAYAVFEQKGIVSEPVLLSNVIHSGKQYKLTYHVSAKEMDDAIILKLYDGEGNLISLYKDGEEYTEGYPYSVNTYVELALGNNSVSDELKDLMRTMRQYGDSAQEYFGYGHPEGSNIQVDATVFEAYTLSMTSNSSKVFYYGSSLLLEDMTTIRHYFLFADNVENYSVTIDGTPASLVKKGDLYYVDIKNIAAQDLEEMPIVIITDAKGKEVYRLVYGAFSYADMVMNQSNNDRLKTLMAALYLYWQSAETYFVR